jgi:hypothetical protein
MDSCSDYNSKRFTFIPEGISPVFSSSNYGQFALFASAGSREDLRKRGGFRYKPARNLSQMIWLFSFSIFSIQPSHNSGQNENCLSVFLPLVPGMAILYHEILT